MPGLQEAAGGWRTSGKFSIGRGVTLPTQRAQLAWRKICPSCLDEARYLRAAWDLTYWVACPIHGRFMVHECPACGRPLGWRGARLDHCCKGTPFAAIHPAEAPVHVVHLMRSLAACSLIEAPPPPEPLRLLLGHLDAGTLCFLITRLGVIRRRIDGQASWLRDCQLSLAEATEVIEAVAGLMADWPRSFHALVQRCEAVNSKVFPVNREFGNFHRYLVRGMPKQECAFVFREYDNALRTQSGPGPSPVPAMSDGMSGDRAY